MESHDKTNGEEKNGENLEKPKETIENPSQKDPQVLLY